MHMVRVGMTAIVVAWALVSSRTVWAQTYVPLSQRGAVSQTVNTTDFVIRYSRPVARGRVLFGGVVPFGNPWNPGADSATQMHVSKDITVAGQPLAAGSYTLWVIPDTAAWTVIFSRAVNIWHVPYPKGRDALRVTLAPVKGEHLETLTFSFPVVGSSSAVLRLQWGATRVDLPMTVAAELPSRPGIEP